jgi:hypothetical protein
MRVNVYFLKVSQITNIIKMQLRLPEKYGNFGNFVRLGVNGTLQ